MKLLKFIAASGLLLFATPSFAQSTATPVLPGLLVTSGCPSGYTACYVPYSNSNPLPVSATITPSGTQDTNLKQVNGATVNVGAGAAGTGTQRVTTSTDSTIGTVTAVTAITNALPAGSNIIGKVGIDQTTPGTTNNVAVDGSVDGAASSGTATSAAVLFTNTNTVGVGYFACEVISAGSGNSIGWESSNDGGTTWSFVGSFQVSIINNVPLRTPSIIAGAQYATPVIGTQMRLRVTTYGSGTVTVNCIAKRTSLPPPFTAVAVGPKSAGTADTGENPVKGGAVYHLAPVTYSDGNVTDDQSDPNGALYINNRHPACNKTIPISQTTSTDLKTFTNIGFLCSVMYNASDAENVSLVEGTGTVCATNIVAIIGGTSAAAGNHFAANGGVSMPSSFIQFQLAASADHLCLLQSGSGTVAGVITYADHS